MIYQTLISWQRATFQGGDELTFTQPAMKTPLFGVPILYLSLSEEPDSLGVCVIEINTLLANREGIVKEISNDISLK